MWGRLVPNKAAKTRLGGMGIEPNRKENGLDRKTVPWLKDYLTRIRIQVTDQGCGKTKAELVEFAED